LKIIILVSLFFSSSAVFSWTNHFLGTYYSLSAMPEMNRLKPVKVESIETFLKQEADNLTAVLEAEEEYARKNLSNYPKRPDSLKFDPKDTKNLRKNFLRALRLNPTIELALFIQELPGKKSARPLNFKKVTIFDDDLWITRYTFTALSEGGTASPVSVAASAADEPDYGHDINLYQDNPSDFGKEFNFGNQPFGSTKYIYGSQAPFHMGFYHEAGIINLAAGFISRTLPEYRIHLYQTLAKFAFERGHDYWGFRFMGWAMHYLGDLTQPYHSTVFPGKSAGGMLWINMKSAAGFKSSYDEAVERLGDRHTAIEHYQYSAMEKAIIKNPSSPLLSSYKILENDSKFPAYDELYPRSVIAKESNERANTLDELIDKSAEVMKFKSPDYDPPDFKEDDSTKAIDKFLLEMFSSFGSHMRNFAKSVMKK